MRSELLQVATVMVGLTVLVFALWRRRQLRLLGMMSEQKQQLDFFFEQAPMAIAVLDARQRYVACSRRWLHVHRLNEAPIGASLYDVPTRRGSTWARVSRESLEQNRTMQGTEHFSDAREEAWFEWTARPWRRRGLGSGTILVVEEATGRILRQKEREETHEKLIRAQNMEMVGQLASGVAHDVKNVLHVIGMHAGLLEKERRHDPQVVESTAAIRQAVDTASGMARWLLSFGTVHQQQLQRIALDKTVDQMAGFLRHALAPDQELVRHVPDHTLWIWADQTLLEQLLINLVLNARDAMPEGGTITVVVEEGEDGPILRVSDEGEGIPDEIRSRMLDPFFTTKGANGTGMGLSVVSRAVDVHAAKLHVESAVGRGSTFTVSFPDPASFDPAGDSQDQLDPFRPWDGSVGESTSHSHARLLTVKQPKKAGGSGQ